MLTFAMTRSVLSSFSSSFSSLPRRHVLGIVCTGISSAREEADTHMCTCVYVCVCAPLALLVQPGVMRVYGSLALSFSATSIPLCFHCVC